MQTCLHWLHGLAALVVHFTWTWASYVCQCRNTSVSYRLNSAFFKTLVLEIFVFSTGSMQPCFIQVHGLAALVVWFIWMHESQVSCIDSDSNNLIISMSHNGSGFGGKGGVFCLWVCSIPGQVIDSTFFKHECQAV